MPEKKYPGDYDSDSYADQEKPSVSGEGNQNNCDNCDGND
jgi:hypothetical protein